jgi:hypothetical protein
VILLQPNPGRVTLLQSCRPRLASPFTLTRVAFHPDSRRVSPRLASRFTPTRAAFHPDSGAPSLRLAGRSVLRVEFVELPHPDAHLHTAVQLYGPAIRAVQAVWADDRGRWPSQRGFRGARGGQPVLGPRARAGPLT